MQQSNCRISFLGSRTLTEYIKGVSRNLFTLQSKHYTFIKPFSKDFANTYYLFVSQNHQIV